MAWKCMLRFFMFINPKFRHTVNEIRRGENVTVNYDSDSD